MRRKGQFLLISAIVIGLMLITTSSTIAEVQSQQFHHDSAIYDVNRIKLEADKIDMSSEKEREKFGQMVSRLAGYSSETRAWDRNSDGDYDCFNVTLVQPGDRYQLECVS
ncbi:MAG: hypothetical protein ABEJ07_03455 [Candidatus Nanohaloarchaea archaeon]